MTASSATIFLEGPVRPVRMPGGVFSGFADLVLTSDDVDQSVRWTPGERLHHLFERRCDEFRAAGDPGHLAVARGADQLTFDELDSQANQLARYLLEHGVRPGDRVGLIFDDALWSYVAMLATLKINAAYVPLDAAFPADRLAYIVGDARVSTVLTVAALRERLDAADAVVLCLDEAQQEIDRQDGARLRPGEHGEPVEELCYIIYTSGTTGRPKGVAIEHAAICNFVRVAAQVYGIDADDRMYQGLTIAFDFSVEEIWVPLMAGATLVPKPGRNLLGEELADYLRAQRVTALCCVPTLLATMDDVLPQLRFLLVSGEACPQDLVDRWHRPGRRFLNVYGPTEATVTATWTNLHPDLPVTIGVPLPTYSVVILAEGEQRALPPGELGEIAIAGVCLSPGYVNRDDLTAKAFIPDFLGIPNNTSGRLYRTGDLGRITPDGLVECLGRIDTQVKIRGYRIELTEIESVLLGLPGIGQAVVDSYEPTPGVVELVAYYTEKPSGPAVDVDAVDRALRDRLPAYMVPAYYERLDVMPMTPNDKADRKNLPAPSGPRRVAAQGPIVVADNPAETAIVDAVAGLLGLEQVSVDSDFFTGLGMNSLLLAQLCAQLRERSELPAVATKDIYQNPTPRRLAAALASTAPAPRPAAAGPREVRVGKLGPILLTGLLQAGIGLAGLLLTAQLLVLGFDWLSAGTGLLDEYLRAVGFGSALFAGLTLLPVLAKWALIGRWKATEIPLWSLRYVRFWLVKSLLRISPLARLGGSPLQVVYLRLLGAKIGRGAVLFTTATPVATDLMRVGAGAVVRKGALLTGYRAESGWLRTGRIEIGRDALVGEGSVLDIDTALGDGAQLGHASALHRGQRVPAGQRWHGSPAEPTGTDFTGVPPAHCGTGRRIGYGLFQLAVLLFGAAPLVTAALYLLAPFLYRTVTETYALVPAITAAGVWTDPRFYLGYLAVSAALVLAAIGLQLLIVLTVPRLLHRFVRPGVTYPLYGIRWVAHRVIVRLSNSAFFNDLLGDSSFIVYFLRAIGYDLAPLRQTGSNFGLAQGHDSPVLTRVGTGTLVSDGLTVANAEYSSSSFTLARAAIGEHNFLGNNIVFPARSRTGDNVLLATKVAVPIDGPVRQDTGLLGSPAFEIPRSVLRDAAHDRYATGAEFTTRLARKNRSNLRTMGAFLLQRILLAYGTLLIGLAAVSQLERFGLTALVAGLLGALAFGTLFSIVAERAAMGFRRLRPQFCSIYQPYYWKHERMWKLSRISFLPVFDGTPVKGFLWRLSGVRVGRRLFDDGAVIPEKTLVTIGDAVTLNAGTVIQCHSLEDASFKSDAVLVGNGATLGVNTFVHYGAELGDRVVLDADSFLMKGERPAADSRWRGNPAREIGEPAPVDARPSPGSRSADAAPPPAGARGPVPVTAGIPAPVRPVGAASGPNQNRPQPTGGPGRAVRPGTPTRAGLLAPGQRVLPAPNQPAGSAPVPAQIAANPRQPAGPGASTGRYPTPLRPPAGPGARTERVAPHPRPSVGPGAPTGRHPISPRPSAIAGVDRRPATPQPLPPPSPSPVASWRAGLAWAGVALLGALVVLRVIVAGLTARVPASEQQLVNGAVAALRGSSVGPLTGWLGEFATRAQLTGYAALTVAFERYADPIDAARELAALAALVTVVGLVTLAWGLRLRPGAVAAGLGLLAVAGPAGLALSTFGPGQLGLMWLVVSAALLAQTGSGARTLGAVAAAAGVLTAPALALPVAAAVVVAAIGGRVARPAVVGPRGLVVAAVVAGLGVAAWVLFGRLPMAPATTALDQPGQLWLLAAAALAVVSSHN
ncbi:MAG TPA: Pls/PosA family non-ribosomal peptide synthetase [Pseudonocardia sp.]|nr:Pls/PosA family non-ribosomal peptide synthetase [Pseudonocardia sp.]